MQALVAMILLGLILFLTGCSSAKFTAVPPTTCTVSGGMIICPDGTSEAIPVPTDGIDGRDGIDGNDGVDGIDGRNGTEFKIVDPCGDGPGADEVVLILDDGRVLAWYKDLGFSLLYENTAYQTTDAQKCNFTVMGGEVFEI
jgi:hypothetical protein